MASYKSAIRSNTTNGQSEPKLKDKAQQLQEFFPSWSHEDLQSLLAEVNGDVELAATRISDGKAEQWGSVSRKKDKKGGNTPKDSAPSPRGDFRGGRGGARGNRGGSARGGAGRPRGDFRGGRGGHANGHVPRTSSPAVSQHVDDKGGDALKPSVNAASEATPSTSQTPASWTDAAKPEESSASSAWGGSSAWGNTDADPDNALPAHVNGSTFGTSIQAASPLSAKQISKSPATSKLSWAQIARPQEKPAAPPAPVVQHPSPQPPVTTIHPPAPLESTTVNHLTSASTPVPAPSEAEPTISTGWEDPTTVENPSFDEEPSAPAAAPEPVKEPEQKSEPETVPALREITASKPPEITVHEQAAAPSAPPTPAPSTPSKVATRPAPISQRNSARYSNYAKIASNQGGVVMPPTPSSIGANLSGISSFGSFGELKSAGVEKVGMQFGSLSLGGTSEPEPEPEVETVEASSTPAAQASMSAPEPISVAPPPPSTSLNSGLYQSQSQPIQTSLSQPTVSSSVATSISNSPAQSFQQAAASSQPLPQAPSLAQLPQQLQQQAAQTQSQNLPSHHHYSQLGLPTHIDQSSQAQVQAQSSPQQVQQQQSYLRQNEQSSYGNNISAGVSSGFHHSPTPPMQDNNGYGAFGSALSSQSLGGQGLGQGLSGMGQGTLGGMGGLGGMSGLGGQGLGHQQQQSLSAFDNYGYEGGQRNFYDSYQPNTFGRGVLGHDDLKGSLPSQQQGQQAPSTVSTGTSTSLPPSVSSQSSVPQSQQSPAASVSSQGQPQLGQGSAPAGYHPAAPLPTFYYQPFPPQNSYYGAAPSNYGYGVGGMGVPQPYGLGKYPTIYPVPPGSAPSPAGKPSPGMGVHGPGGVISHSGIGVQPQSYGGGLYGQQQGYDDYQQHTQQQQQHHQQQGHQHHNSHGLGLGQDYSKQLYGGQGALQGYMSGAGSGVSAGVVSGSGAGPRSGASPETAYKPYAPKDVGVGRGNVQQSQGQGQAQSQGQGQGQGGQGGPQGQGFYGGNRFGSGSSVGAGVGAPQQSAHGAPLYPQGQNDAGYYYQQRQYWQ
ncbi:hypothetical protein F5051DRAFT_456553 [Lentinula edodes]|nr:hypothetical protein F5051DRAFT_456553 [Lentinula edodes]